VSSTTASRDATSGDRRRARRPPAGGQCRARA
jgi:hypothetical protein